MNKSSKSKQIFLFLSTQLGRQDFPHGTRLPTVRWLAREFCASTATVTRVLDRLEKQGAITRVQGGGVFAGGGSKASQAQQLKSLAARIQRPKPKAQEIAECIVSDILHGNFKVGEYLPLQKALRFQYRCSKAATNAALGLVAEKGLIHQRGRTWIVGRESSRGIERQEMVVAIAKTKFLETPFEPRSRLRSEFMPAFENETRANGIALVRYVDWDDRATLRLINTPQCRGILFLHARDRIAQVRRVLQGCQRTEKRAVLADFSTVFLGQLSCLGTLRSRVWVLGVDNLACGRETGIHLALMGHRTVAYLGCADMVFVDQRAKGLANGLERVLGTDAVVHTYWPRLSRDAAKRFLFNKPPTRIVADMQATVGRTFGGYRFSKPGRVSDLLRASYQLIQYDRTSSAMVPHFRKALKTKGPTAWVCSDPIVAMAAMEFLKGKAVRVPEELSLVSIDDWHENAFSGITAYDPQASRMGYLGAHCLLRDIPVRRHLNSMVECPGRLIERGSVKRVAVR